jgi:5-formyltetrahydrofolate cyclo-ligase
VHEAGDENQTRAALRARLRQAREALPEAELRRASTAACGHVAALGAIARARRVALYAATRGELDPAPLAGALAGRVCYPRVVASNPPTLAFHAVDGPAALAPDRFGIPAPPPTTPTVALDALDVVIVPGIAFAPDGQRLGYGRGYYDAALAACPAALRIGLCHTFQIVDRIPARAGDEPVDLLVTPDGARRTGARPTHEEVA